MIKEIKFIINLSIQIIRSY